MAQSNAGERKQVRQAEKRAKLDDDARKRTIANLMATIGGRQYLYDLLSSCSIFHTTFTGEALPSAFNEGRRSVGLAVLDDIMQAAPDFYSTMVREANDRHNADAARRDNDDRGQNADGDNYYTNLDGDDEGNNSGEERREAVSVERA